LNSQPTAGLINILQLNKGNKKEAQCKNTGRPLYVNSREDYRTKNSLMSSPAIVLSQQKGADRNPPRFKIQYPMKNHAGLPHLIVEVQLRYHVILLHNICGIIRNRKKHYTAIH